MSPGHLTGGQSGQLDAHKPLPGRHGAGEPELGACGVLPGSPTPTPICLPSVHQKSIQSQSEKLESHPTACPCGLGSHQPRLSRSLPQLPGLLADGEERGWPVGPGLGFPLGKRLSWAPRVASGTRGSHGGTKPGVFPGHHRHQSRVSDADPQGAGWRHHWLQGTDGQWSLRVEL